MRHRDPHVYRGMFRLAGWWGLVIGFWPFILLALVMIPGDRAEFRRTARQQVRRLGWGGWW